MSVISTKSYLDRILSQLDQHAKRSLGQNFLISDFVIGKIIAATKRENPEKLIEIGPGAGSLTRHFDEYKNLMTLIELDSGFAEHWRKQGFNVTEADALRIDWKQFYGTEKRVLVSNLPYQISSTLLIDRSIDEQPLDTMILMFQKEVAQRIKADLKHESYGFLSVMAQVFWDIELLLEASSGDFSPAPKVASRVLVFKKREVPFNDRKQFLKMMKAAFLHPRKLMVSNLQEGLNLKKSEGIELVLACGWSEKIRPDQLKPADYVDFYQKLGYS